MEIPKSQKDGGRWFSVLEALPGGGRLLQIIWPFLVIVIALLMLSAESMNILVASRSYSEGESLWSKGQKRAMFSLLRYTETRSAADYYSYREAIAVPMGDQKARIELEKADPDFAAAWQGFIEGRNHPEDVPGLIMLFRRFRHIDFMAAVIDLWTEGDRYIAELNVVAEEVHSMISAGTDTPAALSSFRERILEIDTQEVVLNDLDKRLTELTAHLAIAPQEASKSLGATGASRNAVLTEAG